MRGFARRRPDVRVTTLRGRQRRRPPRGQPDHVVLPAAGDPDRARARPAAAVPARAATSLDVLRHAVATDVAGTFNVAGDGVLMLSQAVRRLQRPSVPLPGLRRSAGSARCCARARVADFSPEQLGFLTYGRGVDTTRMRAMLGFEPTFTTAEAFADFAAALAPTGGRSSGSSPGSPRLAAATPAADAHARCAAVGAAMGDAEIIPIGTRGRPGRGTGKRQPSAPRAAWPRAKPPTPRRPQGARRAGRREADATRPAPSAAADQPATEPAATEPRPRARAPRHAEDAAAARAASPSATGWPPSSTPPASCSATSGSRSWPGSWPSCAAG